MAKTTVYLSLGGNQGDVLSRCRSVVTLLSNIEGIEGLKYSHFYLTEPFLVESPQWFVNCVCSFETALSPHEIFKLTQEIEIELGKVPKAKTESRPIDIDLLFYGNRVLCDASLEIPHPIWKERLFVLIPLSDLIDEIEIRRGDGVERYVLKDLVGPLLELSPRSISLLEKNPHL